MGKKKNVHYRTKKITDREKLVSFLRSMADKLEADQLALDTGEGRAEVQVPEQVQLAIALVEKEKKGGTRTSLKLKLTWGAGVSQDADSILA